MEPGRRFYWVPGLSREKVPCGIWSALAYDDEVGGLTNPVLGNHEGGRRPGLCVGLRESWRLVQYVPMYMSERGGRGERGEVEMSLTRIYLVLETKKICGLGSLTRVCEYGTPERGRSVYKGMGDHSWGSK